MQDQTEQAAAQASGQSGIGKPALDNAHGERQIERLPGVHLQLAMGQKIFVRLMCVDQRYEAHVIGVDPFSYFIVQLRLPQDTLTRLNRNPMAIVQLDAGGTLFGFRTSVINRISQPAPLLFFSYPDTVERVVLRRNKRVRVSLPGQVHGAFGDHDVMVVDLAREGCRFSAKSNLNSPLRAAKTGERVLLHCDLGGDKTFMGPVVLRRIEEQRGHISMGGQFVDLSDENAVLLLDYVKRVHSLLGDAAA